MAPKWNERDLDELPEDVRQSMTFISVEMIDDVLHASLRMRQEPSNGQRPHGRDTVNNVGKECAMGDKSIRKDKAKNNKQKVKKKTKKDKANQDKLLAKTP